jgi:hypothetical protein
MGCYGYLHSFLMLIISDRLYRGALLADLPKCIFFTAIAQVAKQEHRQALCWWETGAAYKRRYRVDE